MRIRVDVALKDHGQEKSSTQNGKVLLVTSTLTPLLGLLDGNANPVETVRAALTATYGSQLSEPTGGERYIWTWDPVAQEWIRICTEWATFEIAFPDGETVSVDMWEGAPYRVD
jgi:hypothetical protein